MTCASTNRVADTGFASSFIGSPLSPESPEFFSVPPPYARKCTIFGESSNCFGNPKRNPVRDDIPKPRSARMEESCPDPLPKTADSAPHFAAMGLPVPVVGRGDTATVHMPGSDARGVVVDAGAAISRVKVGQAVILDSWTGNNIRGYETHDGFNAQFAIVDEERAIPLPSPLRAHTPERLAAMLLSCGTAYRVGVEKRRG